jgi:hypothetical protein
LFTEPHHYRKGNFIISSTGNNVYKATRPAILKLFRKNKDEIDVYLRENGIDFEIKNDLVKILLFCHEQARENEN